MSVVAELVRERVGEVPVGSFVYTRDLVDAVSSVEARSAVDVALHRLVDGADLVHVRRGVYYKGRSTRFGPTSPEPLEAALAVARGAGFEDGVGPAGYTAARAFGLTTQVPAREEVAVPGRAPADMPQVHFTSRSAAGRRGLRPLEVALLEVLRQWRRFGEELWATLLRRVADAVAAGDVRVAAVRAAARREPHVHARKLADRLFTGLAESGLAGAAL